MPIGSGCSFLFKVDHHDHSNSVCVCVGEGRCGLEGKLEITSSMERHKVERENSPEVHCIRSVCQCLLNCMFFFFFIAASVSRFACHWLLLSAMSLSP